MTTVPATLLLSPSTKIVAVIHGTPSLSTSAAVDKVSVTTKEVQQRKTTVSKLQVHPRPFVNFGYPIKLCGPSIYVIDIPLIIGS